MKNGMCGHKRQTRWKTHTAWRPSHISSCTAQRLMNYCAQRHLVGEDYDQHRSRSLSENLADTMVQLMKDQSFSRRYKYVFSEHRPEVRRRRRRYTNTTEKYDASAAYAKNDLFAVVVMFAVYRTWQASTE